MRATLKEQEVGLDPHFNYRGKNQTRVETFSDATFALAITLVVLSSSVPATFQELWLSLRDVIPFGLCVVLVMVIWYQHYIFFLRYGLQNTRIIVYNTFLIFLILVYVYPLKFLFKVIVELYIALFTSNKELFNYIFSELISYEDTRALMMIYGMGASFIFATIAIMYRHALKQKESLKLSEYEVFETRNSLHTNLLLGAIPMLSALIALTGIFGNFNFAVSGFAYMLYPPVMILHGILGNKRKKKLIQKLGLK